MILRVFSSFYGRKIMKEEREIVREREREREREIVREREREKS